MSNKLKSYKLDTDLWQYLKDHMSFVNKEMFLYPEQQNCAMADAYNDMAEKVLDFEVFPDDIWVITYPKCGTTWTQEMVWLIGNDLDFDRAKQMDLNSSRYLFIDLQGLSKELNDLFGFDQDKLLADAKLMKRPRFIKAHLPVGLLPRQMWKVKPKIIYVMREPKDVAVSYLHHHMVLYGYHGTKDKFFEAFLTNHVAWGSYWGNVASFWKLRNEPNILVNTFEDMKKDLPGVVRRTATFLGKPVPEDQMSELVDHLHISNIRNNETANQSTLTIAMKRVHGRYEDLSFINKGKVGNYKEKMAPEWIEKFDEWARQEKIKYGLDKDTDFPY